MQKRLTIEHRMDRRLAATLVEMIMKWEDEPPTFAVQRREDGDVDVLMSKRTYERAMAELAKGKLRRIR